MLQECPQLCVCGRVNVCTPQHTYESQNRTSSVNLSTILETNSLCRRCVFLPWSYLTGDLLVLELWEICLSSLLLTSAEEFWDYRYLIYCGWLWHRFWGFQLRSAHFPFHRKYFYPQSALLKSQGKEKDKGGQEMFTAKEQIRE